MQQKRARFHFIDGLRGLAAMSVVFFHAHHGLAGQPGERLIPPFVGFVLSQAFLGVEIFFVISGFVIAHSTWKAWVTPAYAGRFALRRSIRLDPPYWCAIAGTLLLHSLARRNDPHPAPVFDGSQIAAHLVYLQGILKKGQLLDVFWTLCLEVQFYLFYVFVLGIVARLVAKRLRGDTSADVSVDYAKSLGVVLWASGALSAGFFAMGGRTSGWFIEYWFMFSAGALAYCAYRAALSVNTVLAYVALLIVCCAYSRLPEFAVIAAAAVFVLFSANGKLKSDWLDWRLFQFLGLVSYSLYLVHPLVLEPALIQGHRDIHSGIGSLGLTLASILVSVGCATVMYVLIERPSIGLAHRLKLRPAQTSQNDGSSNVKDPSLPMKSAEAEHQPA